jgi:hypothetical protein
MAKFSSSPLTSNKMFLHRHAPVRINYLPSVIVNVTAYKIEKQVSEAGRDEISKDLDAIDTIDKRSDSNGLGFDTAIPLEIF